MITRKKHRFFCETIRHLDGRSPSLATELSAKPLDIGYGRRGRDRTCNPGIRNPVLYPIELRAPWQNLS